MFYREIRQKTLNQAQLRTELECFGTRISNFSNKDINCEKIPTWLGPEHVLAPYKSF